MKRALALAVITSSLLVFATMLINNPAAVSAQSTGTYTLDWYTIDGSSGSSSGGSYALDGTLGQSEAGSLSGGSYTLAGGFWGGDIAPATGNTKVYLPLVLK
jgi:hypothetical protein